VDETGSTTLQITWSFNHSRCLLVDVGTKVVWDGNFDTHPLSGGVSPTEDTSSPIDMAGPGSGTGQVEVTFDATGDYPYFCDTHFMSMTGVVYVQ
jgi:plastocyanin